MQCRPIIKVYIQNMCYKNSGVYIRGAVIENYIVSGWGGGGVEKRPENGVLFWWGFGFLVPGFSCGFIFFALWVFGPGFIFGVIWVFGPN